MKYRSFPSIVFHNFFIFYLLCSQTVLLAQFQLTPTGVDQLSVENLVNTLSNEGSISNIQSNLTNSVIPLPGIIGSFSDPGGLLLGLSNTSGIVLSTGDIAPILNTSSTFLNKNWSLPGDVNLNKYTTNQTYDAAVIEFDFIPFSDSISFDYLFGSEEYPLFVFQSYNDVFAFEILGNEYSNYTNIALIPGANVPVTINTVNYALNQNYFISNWQSFSPLFDIIAINGFTTGLKAKAKVTPCKKYSLRLAIADVNDNFYDSFVFIGGLNLGQNPVDITGATGCLGQKAVLSVSSLSPVPNIKWQKLNKVTNNWEYLVESAVYSGVTSDNLTINNVTINEDKSQFRVEYANSICGTSFSTIANFSSVTNNCLLNTQFLDVNYRYKKLSWEIFAERGDLFEVQYSFDGSNFNKLDVEINVSMNSFYSQIDGLEEGYLRVIKISKSGQTTISKIIKTGGFSSFSIYPNPSNQEFTITYNIDSEIELYSMDGKNILKLGLLKDQKLNFGEDLPKGMYLIKINNEVESLCKKLEKL